MAFEVKTGDTKPWFVVVLKDNYGLANEAIVNLTTASTAVFNMTATSPGTKIISRAGARITNAAGGEVTYCWGTNGAGTQDTRFSGAYQAEVEVTWADGGIETFPGGPSGGNYWDVLITSGLG